MLPLPKLDRIDLRILAQLQSNGRLTNVELARRVGLSASPCLIRVKRLEKSGYIVSYGAQINLQKISSLLTVFTEVTLSDHRRDDFSRFEGHIQKIPSVVECHLVSGGYDYLLKFMTRSVEHYQGVIEALLDSNIGIEKYFSYIVIKSPIIKPAISIESIIDSGT
ncbi:transcriptional regulator, AsnC family [Gluconacetobacter diazotrophicus PA1 5]|uniref:Lrp/AsnC family transcriptional regulator n=2 Tax=Gluconacetobacter diazotrophicus TaxID=33996 RepID=A0A7W4NGM4_GLUDI|nr:Lrp/AsnC family transcriptional regulator [Gluconacetobacter diazotrophicus]ACI51363.1 transcriptional regulator, AsnC family [Gluconacetobacter diazotrophicus PA1 5]MBB2157392.1 Lrp/AsnC family transcriptional regulator [Gluconacetobacter diazotrophicus]TWB09911.1 AsnC family transcriptional regulator [Gluconacetobacter diazotrophicus]CAP54365.1 putative transcriptional regulator, AsnC family [Gluconacetobacter diazotrophicus PA1 5]